LLKEAPELTVSSDALSETGRNGYVQASVSVVQAALQETLVGAGAEEAGA